MEISSQCEPINFVSRCEVLCVGNVTCVHCKCQLQQLGFDSSWLIRFSPPILKKMNSILHYSINYSTGFLNLLITQSSSLCHRRMKDQDSITMELKRIGSKHCLQIITIYCIECITPLFQNTTIKLGN